MTCRKRILVCGSGSIGRRHIRNLKALGAEVSVWRARSQLAAQLSTELEVPIHTDLERAIVGVDAVVVATATDKHLSVAMAAAKAGKAIFLEKPVSHSLAGIAELRQQCEQRVVEVGCQLRAHPLLRRLSEIISEGHEGPLYTFRCAVGQRLDTWRPGTDYKHSYSASVARGGGALFDLIHEIDLVHWLMGRAVIVSARLSTLSDLELQADDLANLIIATDRGAVGQVQMDMLSPVYRRDLEVVLQKALYRWNDQTGLLIRMDAHGQTVVAQVPDGFERNTLFLNHMSHFLERLDNPAILPYCSLDEGIQALVTVLAAMKANATKQSVELEYTE